ncbi:MAG: EthD family reductase [Anaerolineae bacterium]|nr:EthD family reductase [Anaerolineae bacterium]
MLKFMVLFQKPKDPLAVSVFENAYNDFLALIERMPDIQRRQVVNVLSSPMGQPRYYRILEIYFKDQAAMESSLRSPAGQEAGSELGRRFRVGTYESLFAEVYEETGGSTPPVNTTPAKDGE